MRKVFAFLATSITMLLLAGQIAWAAGQTHFIAVHVDSNDPKVQNLALNNVQNITRYWESKGDKVVIEVVAYGPGLTMLIPGKSKVEDRVVTMSLAMDNLTFSACANTRRNMAARLGHEIPIMEEARVVPSGVVRLVELQEKGYAYIRP